MALAAAIRQLVPMFPRAEVKSGSSCNIAFNASEWKYTFSYARCGGLEQNVQVIARRVQSKQRLGFDASMRHFAELR